MIRRMMLRSVKVPPCAVRLHDRAKSHDNLRAAYDCVRSVLSRLHPHPGWSCVTSSIKEWKGRSLLLRTTFIDGQLMSLVLSLHVIAGIATAGYAPAIGFAHFCQTGGAFRHRWRCPDYHRLCNLGFNVA